MYGYTSCANGDEILAPAPKDRFHWPIIVDAILQETTHSIKLCPLSQPLPCTAPYLPMMRTTAARHAQTTNRADAHAYIMGK
jgi:hypothetical protein